MEGTSLFNSGVSSGDGFGFIVPQGYTLNDVSYAYSNVVVSTNVLGVGILLQIAPTGADGTFNKQQNIASWSGSNVPYIYNAGFPGLPSVTPSPLDEPFYVDVNDVVTQELALPLGAGLNWLIVGRIGNTSGTPFSATWNYSIALDVEPVPILPTLPTLPLFATGLGGLGLLGWRRKRKAQAVV